MSKKKKDTRYLADQRNAAYHEAGHAVALIAMGLRFDHVDIKYKPEKNRGGHITGKIKEDYYGTMFSLNEYVEDLCGGMAQSYKNNIGSRGGLSYCGAETDLNNAKEHLNWFYRVVICGGIKFKNLPESYHMCYEKLRDELFDNAQKLVNDNWLQIELVAKELFEKKRLTYFEVMKLLLSNNMYDSLIAPPKIKLEPPVSKEISSPTPSFNFL